ncbi:MAG TPA: segregation/condensation protein A [Chloroflexia bacterium]|nr:segregation/condensation protein A [Chloroflexia bacterium]
MRYDEETTDLVGVAEDEGSTPCGASNGQFQVRLEVFEGPLDLLLKLIERKQLDITRVALAEVAEGFLAYIQNYPEMPPAPLASFVWVASKLLWIKSQTLLPRPPIIAADEEDDPGDELIRRLEAYKRVQEAAKWLREREALGLRSYVRHAALEPVARNEQRVLGTGLEGVDLSRLVRLVQRRMELGVPAGPPMGTVTRGHTVTVAEKVTHLRRRLGAAAEGSRIPLAHEFVTAAERSRTEFVVLFLAVLEIIRRKYGRAEQDELFGEIWLTR